LIEPDLDLFKGHYPDNPIMPGVLLCEAIFQTGALLISFMLEKGHFKTS
jgi:3-hydroxyacyl-[acyl-carrier-protein] dehydratase